MTADTPVGSFEFLATGRHTSCFNLDMLMARDHLRESLRGKRVLVVGGAGSIGSAVVRQLADFDLGCLHIIDQSENNLAELVRQLRSRPAGLTIRDFRTLPLDYGSELMHAFLRGQPRYAAAFNFAALKHVRSEKDPYSLFQMLDTNIAKQVRFLRWLGETGFEGGYYCVSTDKAANPVSLMGASKRLMEHVMFSGGAFRGGIERVNSARFANVAFSDGSLLHAFLRRRQLAQPMAVPRGVKRYFISHEEAADISLLAWLKGIDGQIFVPNFDPEDGLKELQIIAESVIRHLGFQPRYYVDEAEAREAAERDIASGYYPLLLTELDTSGEKPYEEFVGSGEAVVDVGLKTVSAVDYLPTDEKALRGLVEYLETVLAGARPPEKLHLIDLMAACIPQFAHRETGRNLDDRM